MAEPSHLAIEAFFDEPTSTASYLIWDRQSRQAAVIDPALDFDTASGEVDTGTVEALLAAAAREGLSIVRVLETHVHADHLSGAPLVKARTGARIGIGEHIKDVQRIFRPFFNATDLAEGGGDFDLLFTDGEHFALGALDVEVMHTPGHTPADVAYRIEDAVFVGDTLFMPDYGTARADFPGGDPRALYRSIHRLLALPAATRLFMCHDYKAPGRAAYAWESSVGAQRQGNVHVHDGIDEETFVARRTARDRTLAPPKLFMPSIQVNIRAGRLPPAQANGVQYLMIPVRPKGAPVDST